MNTVNGIIIKGIGGFYYVEAAGLVYECKAKGAFRREGITPTVGDNVTVELNENGYNSVISILPRKNCLIRPPLANLERLFIVISAREPEYSPIVTDRLTVLCEHKGITPVIVVNKTDLDHEVAEHIASVYSFAHYDVIMACAETGEGIERIKALLKGGINAFAGNSGVGKSSLLNLIDSSTVRQTGEISLKLGRGRHTTRHVELYHFSDDTYIADTPGFSALSIGQYEIIPRERLQNCFPEFEEYIGKCRFTSCAHLTELDCAVLEAQRNGKIAESRHESYVSLYNEAKDEENNYR